jgi:hypothetical protein
MSSSHPTKLVFAQFDGAYNLAQYLQNTNWNEIRTKKRTILTDCSQPCRKALKTPGAQNSRRQCVNGESRAVSRSWLSGSRPATLATFQVLADLKMAGGGCFIPQHASARMARRHREVCRSATALQQMAGRRARGDVVQVLR